MMQYSNTLGLTLILLLAGCLQSQAGNQSNHADARAGQSIHDGICQATREWGGIHFDTEINQLAPDDIRVKVDMSRTPWDVGVVNAWLETDSKGTAATSSSKAAGTDHEADNIPVGVGVAGMIFDAVRNDRVGSNSDIGTTIGGTAGILMAESRAQKRRAAFDPDTAVWKASFHPTMALCYKTLKVKYWLPEQGVKGLRGVDVSHCFCR